MVLETNKKIKLLIVFLAFILVSQAEDADSLTDLNNIVVCATKDNVNRTFANVWHLYNEFKTSGELWIPVATGPCPENITDCTVLRPVCAVSNSNFFKTFPNQCILETERKTTGTVWKVVFNGICSTNSADGFVTYPVSSSVQAPVSAQAYPNSRPINYYQSATQTPPYLPPSANSIPSLIAAVQASYMKPSFNSDSGQYQQSSASNLAVSIPSYTHSLAAYNGPSSLGSTKYMQTQEPNNSQNYNQAARPVLSAAPPSDLIPLNKAVSTGQYVPVRSNSEGSEINSGMSHLPPSHNVMPSLGSSQNQTKQETHPSENYKNNSPESSKPYFSSTHHISPPLAVGKYNPAHESQSYYNRVSASTPVPGSYLSPSDNAVPSNHYHRVEEPQVTHHYEPNSVPSTLVPASSKSYTIPACNKASESPSTQYKESQDAQLSSDYARHSSSWPSASSQEAQSSKSYSQGSVLGSDGSKPSPSVGQYNAAQLQKSSGIYIQNAECMPVMIDPSKPYSLPSNNNTPTLNSGQSNSASDSDNYTQDPELSLYNGLNSDAPILVPGQYNRDEESQNTGNYNKNSVSSQSLSSSSYYPKLRVVTAEHNPAEKPRFTSNYNDDVAASPVVPSPSQSNSYNAEQHKVAPRPVSHNATDDSGRCYEPNSTPKDEGQQENSINDTQGSVQNGESSTLPNEPSSYDVKEYFSQSYPSSPVQSNLHVAPSTYSTYSTYSSLSVPSVPSEYYNTAPKSYSTSVAFYPSSNPYAPADQYQTPSNKTNSLNAKQEIEPKQEESNIQNKTASEQSYSLLERCQEQSSTPESISKPNPASEITSSGFEERSSISAASYTNANALDTEKLPSYSPISNDVSMTSENSTDNSNKNYTPKSLQEDSNTDESASKIDESQNIYNGVVYQGPYYYEPKYRHINFGNLNFLPAQTPYNALSEVNPFEGLLRHLQYIASIKHKSAK